MIVQPWALDEDNAYAVLSQLIHYEYFDNLIAYPIEIRTLNHVC